jgi:hypothetical protein
VAALWTPLIAVEVADVAGVVGLPGDLEALAFEEEKPFVVGRVL